MSIVALTELLTLNVNGSPVSLDNPIPVAPENITGKFRESFENFVPGVNWTLTTGDGDIVQLDGNAISSSYLVISKDPLTAGTESSLTYNGSFPMPIEAAVGLSMSQRVLGQELSVELVSTETPLPPFADLQVANMGQNSGTLYINTVLPHGLVPGKRVGIRGCTDSRLNYPALVVSSIVSDTQFYCVAGPTGNIPTLTIGPFTSGYVYFRPSLGYAQNGISEIFESTTPTQASSYVRSSAGDALPTGSAAGNQSITVATTVSSQPFPAAYTYNFLPSTEFRINLQADRAQIYDVAVDSTSSTTSRQLRTQVIPDPTKDYTLRFRVTNDAGLTVPTAKIVSAAKAGSTTVTITTAAAHGLTTSDYVTTNGIRNGTDFPPGVVTAVLSTPTSTSFTIVMPATTATVTSFGGFVARVQGNNVPTGFIGSTGGAVTSATVTATELILVSAGTQPVLIGDYVNVYGVRDNSTGADLNVDGVYKVVNILTTTATLSPFSGTVLPAAFGPTVCGGAIIKRTDARIAFVRIFEYLRERVEIMARPSGDGSAAVTVVGGVTVSGSVNAPTPTNAITTDITSAALTATATSAAITPTSSGSSEFNVLVTAVSGTNQTMDVVVQESDDTGTNWYDIYHFPRITATGQYRSPLIPMTGNRVRYVRTITGSSPSFTNAVNRLVVNTAQPLQRQFFDRTIAPNTLNSVTPSFFTEGCKTLNAVISMGAITVAPVIEFEGSTDNSVWYALATAVTPAASTQTLVKVTDSLVRFARCRVSTAGTGATLNYIMVKGIGA